ncbi:MAG TPA: L-threonylcarbamoyladenylate synthase [Polyangiales bacterium]|nr:L-threonylcarbamoyladenylate synthase [Polyangiales bacterium]
MSSQLPAAEVARLVGLLRAGGVVACPTETFVGLLADARNPAAVAEVVRLKGRLADQPIGLVLPDVAALDGVALDVPARAHELAMQHWPGPLSLVLRARPELLDELKREGTVSVRVPGPSPALELVRAFGAPLTATSANRSGEPAARNAAEVRAVFGDALAAIVEGESPGGLPSTIIDATGLELRVLRVGPIRL